MKAIIYVALFCIIAFSGQLRAEGTVYLTTDIKCTISWDASPGAVDYRVISGQSLTTMATAIDTPATSVSCAEAKVNAFGQWYVRVRARNAAGVSDPAELPFELVQVTKPTPVQNLRLVP